MSRKTLFLVVMSLWVRSWSPAEAGEITFDFLYDASFTSAAGANGSAAQSDFAFVGNYISSMIKTSGDYDVTMKFDISGTTTGSSLGFAGSSFFGFENTFNKTLTQALVQTGINEAGPDASVGQATFNFSHSWGFGGTPNGSQFDFRYVVLHEMTHALGFNGLIGSNGSTTAANGFYGWMDQYLRGWNGTEYVKLADLAGGNLVAMAGAAGAVIDSAHPVRFDGPNVSAFLGSAGQSMYTPTTFANGSSLYHVNINNDLMYFSIGPGTKSFGYTGLHQAFLKDLGYVVVPEPGAYALATVSVFVLAIYGKKRYALKA